VRWMHAWLSQNVLLDALQTTADRMLLSTVF